MPGNTVDQSATDLSYWNRRCIPMMSSLLKSCGVYSASDQEAQLRFLQEFVLPNLGPHPSGSGTQIPCMLTFSGFPLQPSINLSGSGVAKLRYAFEPLDILSGTAADPAALGPSQRLLAALVSHLGVWPGWIEAFITAFHPTLEGSRQIQAKVLEYFQRNLASSNGEARIQLPNKQPRLYSCFIAFDLEGPSQAMKVYFNPKTKEAETGLPSCQYTFQVLRTLERFENSTAVDMLEQFLAEKQSVGSVEQVGIDCLPESMLPSARVKIYVHVMSNSFQTVRDYVTLNGRLKDPVALEGLSKLREIWHLLLNEPKPIDDEEWEKPVTGYSPMNMQHRLYITYEMKPGNSNPIVKVYVLAQNYAPDDDTIIRNYEQNYSHFGWPWGEDGSYRKIIESALYVIIKATFDDDTVLLTQEF
ncbi:hypothetical protein JDV02_010276 [Purpureocillium takamizusanense]|uniref:Aromatic prenyltransferase n=1 Tax=Purpureocillium takamizusanense TaxID=2060973 RepID=A0A9Q8QRQ0_9HYPO|nr:uncharacterized protein JDV02_010276 [Purpureocillium takamizusanense]UNI24540.1 hypothetical protein JDV02_010276 [Purpureocillium takamizusanense]